MLKIDMNNGQDIWTDYKEPTGIIERKKIKLEICSEEIRMQQLEGSGKMIRMRDLINTNLASRRREHLSSSEEVIAENSLKVMKNMNLQLQQPQHTLNRIIKKKFTPSHCNEITKPNQTRK